MASYTVIHSGRFVNFFKGGGVVLSTFQKVFKPRYRGIESCQRGIKLPRQIDHWIYSFVIDKIGFCTLDVFRTFAHLNFNLSLRIQLEVFLTVDLSFVSHPSGRFISAFECFIVVRPRRQCTLLGTDAVVGTLYETVGVVEFSPC